MKYKTILIDPPWYERGGGRIKRGADRHYNLMKTEDIISTILNSGAFTPDENCHLYLWVTNNFLKDGLFVMERLGFRYVTNLVWVKDRFGLGQYFRGQHELVLFGVKGKLPACCKTESTVVIAKKTEHSKKPYDFYAKIEKVSMPPRLEMFSRIRRDGWDAWGNQIPSNVQKTLMIQKT